MPHSKFDEGQVSRVMRIPRVYFPHPLKESLEVTLSGQPATHIIKVLRMKEGALLSLFNGEGGEYLCEIQLVSRSQLELLVKTFSPRDNESPLSVTLLQGVSKGERMDFVMQKSVELGVTRIVPVMMERSVVNLKGERSEKRREHWQKVVQSACEQSGRNRVPEVSSICKLPEYLASNTAELGIILQPNGAVMIKELLEPTSRSITVLIGPEGGMSDREIALAEAARFSSVQVGPRILRTETAALTVVALLQAQWGDI